MGNKKPRFSELLKQTIAEWQEDKAARLAAALSFNMLFSLAPLLIVVIGVTGLVLGRQAASGELFTWLSSVVGESTSQLIQAMIAGVYHTQASLPVTLLGLGL